jgi:hypothetical protein
MVDSTVRNARPLPISRYPRLLSVKQAAAYTGATMWAIREWIDRRLAERV